MKDYIELDDVAIRFSKIYYIGFAKEKQVDVAQANF